MTEFVTAQDVESLLGPGWAGDGDPVLALEQANAWLSAYNFKAWEEQPAAVTRAGAELAKEAAAGRLYADRDPAIKSKSVKADTVETETTYQDKAVATSGALDFVHTLLTPFIARRSTTRILKRL